MQGASFKGYYYYYMPSRNLLKIYVEGGFYHIYNRGVEKRIIFEDEQDYKVFLNYLKEALSSVPDPTTIKKLITLQGASFKGVPRQPKNFLNKIQLLAYCLMPNHFHFLIKQTDKNEMQSFMRSLITRYSMYFNKRYKRVGKLFQGHYKACMITEESYLIHLSRYIHLNPLKYTSNLAESYSSYSDYLKLRKTFWVNSSLILSFFEKADKTFYKRSITYKSFVENNRLNSVQVLGDAILEDDL